MKIKFLSLALILASALFFSCEKKENIGLQEGEGGAPAPVTSGWNTGYVIRSNGSLMILETDTGSETDKTKWNASMTLGERVSIGEIRKAMWDGRVFDFMKIRRDDGTEGLAFASQVAVGGRLAVVIDEKINLYNTAQSISVTGFTLPYKTILVCYPETETSGFIELRGYESAQYIARQNFVRTSSISRRDSDIQSSILLQTAEPLENTGPQKVRKDALLEAAMLDYPDSVFSAEIRALVNPNATAVIETEPSIYHSLYVIEDRVNVRDRPDPVAGKVIGQVNDGDEVMVIERTRDQFTVGGKTDHWYHISSPFQGWVFGALLDH
jgi:hypothetical protein